MSISRRDFLKISGGAAVGGISAFSSVSTAEGKALENKLEGAKMTTTICPYCGVGCGFRVYTKNGKVINIEGDPEHPISRGHACSKGSSLYQLVNNPTRVTKPMYRAPGALKWKEVEWDWILDKIARKVKDTRDASFERKNDKGQIVNRTQKIVGLGSAALDNEECFLLQKFWRSLGLIYIEHQARI
jgi:formate dehydrogenase major subunit